MSLRLFVISAVPRGPNHAKDVSVSYAAIISVGFPATIKFYEAGRLFGYRLGTIAGNTTVCSGFLDIPVVAGGRVRFSLDTAATGISIVRTLLEIDADTVAAVVRELQEIAVGQL